jgi:hypothetical protein
VYKSPFNPPYWTSNKENAWIVVGDDMESPNTALIITSDSSTNSINVFCDLVDPDKPVPVCAVCMRSYSIMDASNVMFYGDVFSIGGDYGVIRALGTPRLLRLKNVQIIATDKSVSLYGLEQPNTAACISFNGSLASENYTNKNGQIFLHDCKLYYKSFLEVAEGSIFPEYKHRSCIFVSSYDFPGDPPIPAWTNIFASSTYFSVSTIGEYSETDMDYAKWHAIHIETNSSVNLGIDAGVTLTFSACTFYCNTEARIDTNGEKQSGECLYSYSTAYNIGVGILPDWTYCNWKAPSSSNYTDQGMGFTLKETSIYTYPFYSSIS